ncbi:MAG TPA: MFS transporter [Streptosporangiaceae bacterium]
MISARTVLRHVPRTYWIILGGTFTNNFGNFVLPFLFVYAVRDGVPASLAGLPVAGYGAGAVIASILGGVLTDRWGCRLTIIVSMVASACAMFSLAVVHPPALLVLTATMAGLFANLYRPAVGALVADLATTANRATMYAAYRSAMNLGMAVGVGLAGLLADHAFLLLFIGDAVSSLVFACLAIWGLPADHGRAHARPTPGMRVGVRHDRPFLLFLLASTVVWLVYYQLYFGLPLRVGQLGYPNHVLGLLISFSAALVLVAELPVTYRTQSWPREPAIAAGALLVGLGFALLGPAHSWWTLGLCVVVFTAGEVLIAPLGAAYVMDVSPDRAHGRYQGAWNLTRSIGMLSASSLGGLAVAVAPWLLWVCCAAGGLLSCVAVLVVAQLRR